ncbi:MAG: hypothetical protein ACOZF2_07355 [Thermodesulfobacteriota bacterium]
MRNTDLPPEATSPKGKSGRKAQGVPAPLLVSDLGWSSEEAKEMRDRLAAFEEDWDAQSMKVYDHL